MFRKVRGYGERRLKMISWEEIPVELRILPLLTPCNVVWMQNKKAKMKKYTLLCLTQF